MSVLTGPWDKTTLSLSRWYEAPVEDVFEAFTEPSMLRQWWRPRDFTIEELDFPAAEGAVYLVRLRAPDGSIYAHTGTVLEVRPPDRLSYSWRWIEGPLPGNETLVELEFHAEKGGTRVDLRHSRFPDQCTRDAHRGWPESFEALSGWLADRCSAR